MHWAVIYRDRTHGRITVARNGDSREQGLYAAAGLAALGHEVHALVSPDGHVTPREAIADFCRGDAHGPNETAGGKK